MQPAATYTNQWHHRATCHAGLDAPLIHTDGRSPEKSTNYQQDIEQQSLQQQQQQPMGSGQDVDLGELARPNITVMTPPFALIALNDRSRISNSGSP